MSRASLQRCTDYLRHIVEAIDTIQAYTVGMDATAFLTDRKTCDAVIRNIEIIGEACNNVTKHRADFAATHASIPWGFAYEMRNALSHGYFNVDNAIVWQTVQHDLPNLRAQVGSLI
ncbi:MAG: DUF86 domain-containing protein [Polaromonas sp.]